MVRDHLYCLPCRTCSHNWHYVDFWDPACTRCVRDLHTYITFEGPRIRDLELYVQEALRWGIEFDNIRSSSFADEDRLLHWTGRRTEPFNKWNIERPPHFDAQR